MRQGAWRPRESLAVPLVLLVVSLLISFAGSLVASSVEPRSETWWAVTLGSSGLGLALLFGYLVWHFRRPVQVQVSQSVVERARPCRGLVVLVSPGPGSELAKAAIRYHDRTLVKVWLVCSETSEKAADDIAQELTSDAAVRTRLFEKVPLLDLNFENHPEAVREAIEEKVFRALPADLAESDVLVDISGGRKATTAGAFLAALPPGRRVQYVQPSKKDERGRGEEPGEPVEIAIHYSLRRC